MAPAIRTQPLGDICPSGAAAEGKGLSNGSKKPVSD